MQSMRIYLAGPLFTEAERNWMLALKNRILDLVGNDSGVEVIWPWELFKPGEIEQLADRAGREIFERCRSALDDTDIVIALLDGPVVDDGTAWEIGYVYSKRDRARQIIGIRTDHRNAGEIPGARVNAMIEYSCNYIVSTQDQVIDLLAQILK